MFEEGARYMCDRCGKTEFVHAVEKPVRNNSWILHTYEDPKEKWKKDVAIDNVKIGCLCEKCYNEFEFLHRSHINEMKKFIKEVTLSDIGGSAET